MAAFQLGRFGPPQRLRTAAFTAAPGSRSGIVAARKKRRTGCSSAMDSVCRAASSADSLRATS